MALKSKKYIGENKNSDNIKLSKIPLETTPVYFDKDENASKPIPLGLTKSNVLIYLSILN